MYLSIYAASFANRFGLANHSTAQCFFSFNLSNSSSSRNNQRKILIWIVVILFVVFLFLGFGGFCVLGNKLGKKKRKIIFGRETSLFVQMKLINQSEGGV
ncbi:hypothetical protein RHMOL_Rhmol09G0267300 [Rhododendron molle]|uniref:Uncharacterized protein n=1 Tax=Rhododendron molle TaxID=49168 RepID=A0ACC0MI67_RHOML|nr:hypothetical protein RHMOL_Rhmol09G0267300 [Rhododendron molle]